MKDYRLKENREEYFTELYRMNLENRVMPGLVYLYMPALAYHFNWSDEDKLWFAFINGNTQNPITSLCIFKKFPQMPRTVEEHKKLSDWFNASWSLLRFDTDRRYNKKDFPDAVLRYNVMTGDGSQADLLTGKFKQLWDMVYHNFYSFGRLSSFSYLEYVKIMGFGDECDNLFWEDKSGSKSHRNGMLFLLGHDDLVWDKRLDNGFDGSYDFKKMTPWLNQQANEYLFRSNIKHKDLGYFTLESNLCTFKNGFFKHRYPGVYSDMAWDRIKQYDEKGMTELTEIFKEIRASYLPDWLREECESKVTPRAQKASQFADTGIAFRSEHFMEI